MTGEQITRHQLIEKPTNWGRHIVIVGAGASVAAFPHGDANGKTLPTMDNLINMLGLDRILQKAGIKDIQRNFETVYSELYEKDSESDILKDIEDTVYAYFCGLKLPEKPTLYDHLLISLRPKDVIATFNWDPFLFDAWYRLRAEEIPLPEILHLHGDVRLTYCADHRTYGTQGMICPVCEQDLIPSRLLYPVTLKPYAEDPFVKTEWEVLKEKFRGAKTLTIFGYGAPSTDKEAVNILETSWDKKNRLIERTEIIDIKDKETLWKQWEPFIIRRYLDCPGNFYESRLADYPRRTCEALFNQTANGLWVERNPLPMETKFAELLSWVKPLIEAEHNYK